MLLTDTAIRKAKPAAALVKLSNGVGYSQDEATAHGFRATASSLLNENGL